jgi:hypothetical protein
VDTNAVTLASVKGQLRGLQKFFWQPWNNAATWCIKVDCGNDQALAWADESIKVQPSFANLTTKAKLIEKKDPGGASKLRADAMKIAGENDVNALAYQLSPTRGTPRRSTSSGRTSRTIRIRGTPTTASARRWPPPGTRRVRSPATSARSP